MFILNLEYFFSIIKCPLCIDSDYIESVGGCIDQKRNHFYNKKTVCGRGVMKNQTISDCVPDFTFPYWSLILFPIVGLILFILISILVVFLWYRLRKLKNKYQILMDQQNGNDIQDLDQDEVRDEDKIFNVRE